MGRSESGAETEMNGRRRAVIKGIGAVGLGGTFGVGQATAQQDIGQRGPGSLDDSGSSENTDGEEAGVADEVCFQADLAAGEPIEEFEGEDAGYAGEIDRRLLEFLFACSDDEEAVRGEDFGFAGTWGSVWIDGHSGKFEWDTFVFDPDTQELTVEGLTLTWTSRDSDELQASIAAYAIDPELAEKAESGDLTEQEFIAAETATLEENEPQTVTLDLSDALP